MNIRKEDTQKTLNNVKMKSNINEIFDLPPLQKEIKLQQDRIFYILDTTVNKLKISACLPRLLWHEACLLKRYLRPEEVNFIQNACMKFCIDNASAYQSDLKSSLYTDKVYSAIENIEKKVTFNEECMFSQYSMDNFGNPHMEQVIEMLWDNKDLRLKLLKDFDLIPKSDATNLVSLVKDLRELMVTELPITAEYERTREKKLKELWLETPILEKEVEYIKTSIEQQRNILGNKLECKNSTVVEYKDKIQKFQSYVSDQHKHTVSESEKKMLMQSVGSTARHHELAEKAKNAANQYETLLHHNMVEEKKKRTRRKKIESQLMSWLNKFDAEVGEKNDEYEHLEDCYFQEKAAMDYTQQLIDEQADEYDILYEQMEEEEQAEWERIAFEFLRYRSARKIQRYWRAYRKRKIARRKARKAMAKQQKLEGKQKSPKPPKAADSAKKEKKGKKKGEQEPAQDISKPDPLAALGNKFQSGLFDDLKGDEISTIKIPVNLTV